LKWRKTRILMITILILVLMTSVIMAEDSVDDEYEESNTVRHLEIKSVNGEQSVEVSQGDILTSLLLDIAVTNADQSVRFDISLVSDDGLYEILHADIESSYFGLSEWGPLTPQRPGAEPVIFQVEFTDLTIPSGIPEGTYSLWIRARQPSGGGQNDWEDEDHELENAIIISEDSLELEVTQWPTASDITYGDSLSDSTLTGGVANVDGTFSFDNPNSTPDAGIHNVSVTFTPEDENLDPVTETIAITIQQRAIEVTADDLSKIYGEDDPAFTYHITNGSLVNGDDFTGALTRDTGENVGTYAITQGDLALNDNYTLSVVPGELEITPRAITVTANNRTKIYGQDDPTFTYYISSGALQFEDAFTGEMKRVEGEDVGFYAIQQGSFGLSNNYTLTFIDAELEITPRTITITANNRTKIYGQDDPTFTYYISSGGLQFEDAFTGDMERAEGENVGIYSIQQGSLALNDNYDLIFIGAELEITPRAITVTANNRTKIYGQDDPAFTYYISSGALQFQDAFTGDLDRVEGEDVGFYGITQGNLALNDNYTLTFVDAELEITPRPITVTANNRTKIYGQDDPAFTYYISSGALQFQDAFTGDLDRVGGEDVGFYAIQQGTFGLNDNYTLTFIDAELEITPRPITVTANDRTKIYGQDDPAFTYYISSGALQFQDAFTGDLDRAEGEDVGFYAIQQGTFALNDNYDLTFVGAELEITRRSITVTAQDMSKIYGAADPTFQYMITEGSLAFGDYFIGSLSREPGEEIGFYIILQGDLALNDNYEITFEEAEFQIYYGMDGLFAPGSDDEIVCFKTGRAIPLKWAYTDADGNFVDSSDLDLQVHFKLADTDDESQEISTPGNHSLSYNSNTMTWHVNWHTKGMESGLYELIIYDPETGQNDVFYINLK